MKNLKGCVVMEKIILNVWGMEFGSCKAALTKALMGTTGIDEVSVNLPTGKVTVTYNPEIIGRDDMVKVIKGIGYEVLD
jgi:copper chaperone CopZ